MKPKKKKVEYMSAHIGEEFEGVISGVTAWGFYVELPDTIEGLVHVTSLKDDYYDYFESTYELVGQITNHRYKLGQKVRVVVTATDALLRTIDFELADETKRGMKMSKEGIKLIANNKKARHDYFLEELYETGISLHGTEVKSLRLGKCSVKEAFVPY